MADNGVDAGQVALESVGVTVVSIWVHALPDVGYFTAVVCRPTLPDPRAMTCSSRFVRENVEPGLPGCCWRGLISRRACQINSGFDLGSCVTGCWSFLGRRLSTDATESARSDL